MEPGQDKGEAKASGPGDAATGNILALLMQNTPKALADGGGRNGGDETQAAVARMGAL
jgi:hypothetical protein